MPQNPAGQTVQPDPLSSVSHPEHHPLTGNRMSSHQLVRSPSSSCVSLPKQCPRSYADHSFGLHSLLLSKNLQELRSPSTSDETIDGSSDRTSGQEKHSDQGEPLPSSPLQYPSAPINSKVGGEGSPDNNVESRTPQVCPICGGGYDRHRRRYELPCKGIHQYHEACIYAWLSQRPGCPLCQSRQLISTSGCGRTLLPVPPQRMSKQQHQGPWPLGGPDDFPDLPHITPSSSSLHGPQGQVLVAAADKGRWARIHDGAVECLNRIRLVAFLVCCLLKPDSVP